MITQFKNGLLVKNHRLERGDLWVYDQKIIKPQPHADREIDVGEKIIAPGYIDLQINGAFGYDFSKIGCPYDLVAQKLTQFGVTSFLATIVSSPKESYPQLLASGAKLLGFHLEGPFLNPQRKGAHRLDWLRNECAFYESLEHVKLVTLAPELKNSAQLIATLKEKGIVVAAGHTEASFEEIEQSGVNMITHLFNTMPPLQGRQPGPIGAALTLPNMYYSIIADGVHCHPAAIKIAYQCNPKGLILVSDAMSALGLGNGHFSLGGAEVEVAESRAYVKGTQTLAGSIQSLDASVRYLHNVVGCSIVEAIEAATLHPAQLLGISHQKGTFNPGSDADIIVLDKSLFVQEVYVAGTKQ